LRVLLDMQGAQGASRHAGVGRYVLGLAGAMAATRGTHELFLLVNAGLADSAAAIAAEFGPLLGHAALRRFTPPEGITGRDPQAPLWRVAELIRAEAVADATPDALLLGSLFEGVRDSAVVTWPPEIAAPPSAAVLHDLIPLSLPELYFEGLWREAGILPWYRRGLDQAAAVDRLLCNSEATRAEARRHLDVPPARLAVIGGGVEAGFAPPAPGTPPPHGLAPGYLLLLGAGDPRKNEGVLLDAFARLPPALRARHPLAIGHVDPARVREAAARRGLSEAEVLALPFTAEADLPALYARAALVVFPSLAEGFGFPALEAMACGAAVIASDRPALPELLGRADALFDPTDAPALASLLTALLEDPARRADLAAHGRRRARAFSWEGVAARAWAALEAWGPRRHPGRLPTRPSLALVAPLPPAPSGIADYTAELAPALARHYALTLVSPAPPAPPLEGRFPWMAEDAFHREGGRFDRVVYQIGNNPLHAEALGRLLPRHPGVVTLHDPTLLDLRNRMRAAAPDDQLAGRVVEEGYPAALGAEDSHGAAGLLADALGVVVHSGHALWRLGQQEGIAAARHAVVVPHLRARADPPPRAAARARLAIPADATVIAAFGLVTARKCPLELLGAFARLAPARPALQLVFVGGAEDALDAALLGAAAQRGLERRVAVTGRLPRAAYDDWLGAADLAVQLRVDSQGETSGAVKDALMAGLPVLVNAHGAMAELPEAATAQLPEAFTEAELAHALARLLDDAPRRAGLGAAARAWALATLAPAPVAARLAEAIEAAYALGPQAGLHRAAALARPLALTGAALAAAGEALAATWPGARRARLWLDTALPDRAEGIAALLREGAGAWRPEPLRLDAEGRPVTDHAWAWARLALRGPPPEDGPAIMAPGDLLISEAPGARSLALALGCALLPAPPPGPEFRAKVVFALQPG
jgi:glycosyltransferase involved in cell wall biosynthesis